MSNPENLADVCAELSITCDARYGEAKGECLWTDSKGRKTTPPQNWRVTLKFGRRRMSLDFFGGGSVSEPDATTVLASCCIDVSGIDQDFDSWCGDFGYDPDSRAADRIYKACKKLEPKLRRFLGDSFERCCRAEY